MHITELRAAINALRVRLGLSNYPWTTSATTNDYISANPIIEMRTALNQALGPPASPGYATGLAQGQPIKAIHIQELRDRLLAAWNLYSSSLTQAYDGDGLRVKKTQNNSSTYYLRSSVLGGQVIAELDTSGNWMRGYVYSGSGLLAIQQDGVYWNHEDPVTKSKRVTDINGTVVSAIETDPWGADTNRSFNQAFQPHRYTSYTRDANGGDDAMFRRYQPTSNRFNQPDPYDGSYNLTDPQSFNRYAYVQNDPVNFVDPTGLDGETFGINCIGTNCAMVGGGLIVNSTSGNATGRFGGGGVGSLFGDTAIAIEEGPTEIGGGGGGLPQNTLQDVIREDAQTAASQKLIDNKDCRTFIERLLSETRGTMNLSATGVTNVSAWYGLNAYSAAAVAGNISASHQSGKKGDWTTWGTTTAGKISWNKEFYNLSTSDAALHILHESLHLIDGFTDQALARAASMISDPRKPKSFALDNKGRNAASQYLNDQIKKNCG